MTSRMQVIADLRRREPTIGREIKEEEERGGYSQRHLCWSAQGVTSTERRAGGHCGPTGRIPQNARRAPWYLAAEVPEHGQSVGGIVRRSLQATPTPAQQTQNRSETHTMDNQGRNVLTHRSLMVVEAFGVVTVHIIAIVSPVPAETEQLSKIEKHVEVREIDYQKLT